MRIRKLVVGELQTNCYIVADAEGEAAIIDPGGDASRIEKIVDADELTPKYILCTHGHPDHTFAAGRLQASYNIELLVHKLDTPLIEEGPAELAYVFDMAQYQKPAVGAPIADGQVISVGSLRLQAIHTPGHTPGSISFVYATSVFTGDALFACGVGRTDLPGGSTAQLIRSIKTRLLTMDDETRVYPGHGDETTIGEERRDNPFLRGAESEE